MPMPAMLKTRKNKIQSNEAAKDLSGLVDISFMGVFSAPSKKRFQRSDDGAKAWNKSGLEILERHSGRLLVGNFSEVTVEHFHRNGPRIGRARATMF